MKRIIALTLALLMMFCVFAGCKKSDSGTDSNQGQSNVNKPTNTDDVVIGTGGEDLTKVEVHPSDKTMRMCFDVEPLGMTQPGAPFAKAYNQTHIFADCLVKWDSNTNTIVPNLATSWEWIDDTTLRMHLQEGVTSMAGDPFTASDVVFTWQLGCDLAANASYFGIFDMTKTKAVDDYTVDIGLLNPYPYLIQDLSNWGAYAIVVEKTYNDIGGAKAAVDDPSAQTGPYKLVKWDYGTCVYAERREDYWGTKPYYKYIEEWTVTDPNTRAMGVEAGDYDLDHQATASEVIAADGSDKVKGWSINCVGSYTSFMLNSDQEPLNVKEVRQAISLAIDREALLEVAIGGLGFITDSVYGPLHPAYCEASAGVENCYRFDLEAAKQKLVDAGYADGFTIDCKFRNSGEVSKSAELLHSMLSKININLELVIQESATWYTDMRSGNWDTHVASGGNPNPKRLMTSVNPNSTHNSATGCSGANWYPEGTAELIDKCLTTVDDAQRTAYLTEFQDICRENVPMVILFCKSTFCLSNTNVTFIGSDVMGTVDFASCYEADYIG